MLKTLFQENTLNGLQGEIIKMPQNNRREVTIPWGTGGALAAQKR